MASRESLAAPNQTPQGCFDQAVHELHNKIFAPYWQWRQQVNYALIGDARPHHEMQAVVWRAPFVKLKLAFNQLRSSTWWGFSRCACSTRDTEKQLSYDVKLRRLALYFLIYSESANLRTMPECMWWLFWVLAADLHTDYQVSSHSKNGAHPVTDGPYHFLTAIQPIFDILAEEVPKNSVKKVTDRGQQILQADKDHSQRLNYDDINECFAAPDTVQRLCKALSGKRQAAGMVKYEQLKRMQQQDYESIFCKTFVEHRLLINPYRSYFRVSTFHILWFQIILTCNWLDSLGLLTTVVLTHAGLCLLCQASTAYMWLLTWISGVRTHRLKRSLVKSSILSGLWVGINVWLWFLFAGKMWTNCYFRESAWLHSWMSWHCNACHPVHLRFPHKTPVLVTWDLSDFTFLGYGVLVGAHFLIADFRIGYNPLSSRASCYYLQPACNLQLPWHVRLRNIIFWAFVLTAKAFFDWFAVVGPLREPIYLLFYKSEVPQHWAICLCIVRAAPNFIAAMFDTGIFYMVVAALWGLVKGFAYLNLGTPVSFEDLRAEFHSAPQLFATYMLPKAHRRRRQGGKSLLKSLLGMQKEHASQQAPKPASRVVLWQLFANTWNMFIDELHSSDHLSAEEQKQLKFVCLKQHEVRLQHPALEGTWQKSGEDESAASQHSALEGSMHVPQGLDALDKLYNGTIMPAFFHSGSQQKAVQLVREIVSTKGPGLPSAMQLQDGVLKHIQELLEQIERVTDVLRGFHENFKHWSDADKAHAHAEVQKVYNGFCTLATSLRTKLEENQAECGCLKLGKSSPRSMKEFINVLDDWLKTVPAQHEHSDLALCELPARFLATPIMQAAQQLAMTAKPGAQVFRPKSSHAQRVLRFFLGSLQNNSLKAAPDLRSMRSLTTLTPHYSEQVMFPMTPEALGEIYQKEREASMGCERAADAAQQLVNEAKKTGMLDLTNPHFKDSSIIACLRSIHQDEWANFSARMKNILMKYHGKAWQDSALSEQELLLSEADFRSNPLLQDPGIESTLLKELMKWAAFRLPQLYRTVSGMSCYAAAMAHHAAMQSYHTACNDPKAVNWDMQRHKYSYVVASQLYGTDRNETRDPNSAWRALGVEHLLQDFPDVVRIAFLEPAVAHSGCKHMQYSTLAVGDNGSSGDGGTVHPRVRYRMKLPTSDSNFKRTPILGEGKPENQNHAIIFAFGEALQSIDANQDANFAEALKMPHLLGEFGSESALDADKDNVALVGFREWIFSEENGAPASFAAATEFVFGTITQRVMQDPGACRFHYGHPDLWNKLWIMTRGGLSKACKGLHISEDVFAGYKHMLLGGQFKYKEYLEVGKGRDMSFAAINGFERKVAAGNGEQVLSRDVYRLATRMDFFRLMSWYHTGNGFYINCYLIMLGVYITVISWLILVVTGKQILYTDWGQAYDVITGKSLALSSLQVGQLGALGIIMYVVECGLEQGILKMTGKVLHHFVTGSLLFFIFRARTSAYHFLEDVVWGGASYVDTGRGVPLTRLSFVQLYSDYARSHIYWAVQLFVLLLLLHLVGIVNFWVNVWGPAFVCFTMLAAPLWFNPNCFSLQHVKEDFAAWRIWMRDGYDPKAKCTWSRWHTNQFSKRHNSNQDLAHPFSCLLVALISKMPSAFVAVMVVAFGIQTKHYGRCQTPGITCNKWTLWLLSVVCFTGFAMLLVLVQACGRRLRRLAQLTLFAGIIALSVVFARIYLPGSQSHGHDLYMLVFLDFQSILVLSQLAMVAEQLMHHVPGGKYPAGYIRGAVSLTYWVADYAIGFAYFLVLFVLAHTQVAQWLQSLLLFNSTFTKHSMLGQLLKK
ncbi:hypothetical protein WJX73_005277 [Symbiochloris irregularis]|uniref:1,3-beta-glucan synthase n=1 Tax=Symbiochloris irregularis TaxID=706552 RepID=A0AAW1P0A7_9CHLO